MCNVFLLTPETIGRHLSLVRKIVQRLKSEEAVIAFILKYELAPGEGGGKNCSVLGHLHIDLMHVPQTKAEEIIQRVAHELPVDQYCQTPGPRYYGYITKPYIAESQNWNPAVLLHVRLILDAYQSDERVTRLLWISGIYDGRKELAARKACMKYRDVERLPRESLYKRGKYLRTRRKLLENNSVARWRRYWRYLRRRPLPIIARNRHRNTPE